MSDEARTREGGSGTAAGITPGITPLGHEAFAIDTRMAGYRGITAGYLIRSDRPCLVETGTAPSAPIVRDALASLGVGPDDLATVVVTHIHLDHAGGVGRTKDRYKGLRDVDDKNAGKSAGGGDRSAGRGAGEKLMKLTGTRANVSGIMHWLDKTGDDARHS